MILSWWYPFYLTNHLLSSLSNQEESKSARWGSLGTDFTTLPPLCSINIELSFTSKTWNKIQTNNTMPNTGSDHSRLSSSSLTFFINFSPLSWYIHSNSFPKHFALHLLNCHYFHLKGTFQDKSDFSKLKNPYLTGNKLRPSDRDSYYF